MENNNLIHKAEFKNDQTEAQTHYHNEYELLLITDGEIEITINQKEYLAKKGSLIFVSNHEQHSVKILRPPYSRCYTIIYPPLADKLIDDRLLISILKNRPESFCHCLDMRHTLPELKILFDRMIAECAAQAPLKNELCACYLKELLIMVLRNNESAFTPVQLAGKAEIVEIQNYIENHFRENIKIADIAKEYFLSIYYLSHSFKLITGYSPKQYLLLMRLSHARELLINTSISILNICYDCGFNDANNFIRVFKREYSMTPLEYRQTMQYKEH